jgi:hypothetical protein
MMALQMSICRNVSPRAPVCCAIAVPVGLRAPTVLPFSSIRARCSFFWNLSSGKSTAGDGTNKGKCIRGREIWRKY